MKYRITLIVAAVIGLGFTTIPKAKLTPLPVLECWIPCRLISVHDADTIRADILLPWGTTMRDESIRAANYDSWEVNRTRMISNKTIDITDAEITKGKAATAAFRKLLDCGQLYLSPAANEDREGRGRILANWAIVTREGEVIDVAKWMKDRGHCRKD